jgi:hypothetical protein
MQAKITVFEKAENFIKNVLILNVDFIIFLFELSIHIWIENIFYLAFYAYRYFIWLFGQFVSCLCQFLLPKGISRKKAKTEGEGEIGMKDAKRRSHAQPMKGNKIKRSKMNGEDKG